MEQIHLMKGKMVTNNNFTPDTEGYGYLLSFKV